MDLFSKKQNFTIICWYWENWIFVWPCNACWLWLRLRFVFKVQGHLQKQYQLSTHNPHKIYTNENYFHLFFPLFYRFIIIKKSRLFLLSSTKLSTKPCLFFFFPFSFVSAKWETRLSILSVPHQFGFSSTH